MTRKRLSALAAVLAVAGAILIGRGFQKTVTLVVNGQEEEIKTSSWTLSSFLNENQITLNDGDLLIPGNSNWLFGGERIAVETANWINVHADGESTSIFTRQRIPEYILSQLDIRFDPGDLILINGKTGQLDSRLDPGQNHTLQVLRAQPISLTYDDKKMDFFSTKATLGEALIENGIDINAGDRLFPGPETPLNEPIESTFNTAREVIIHYKGGSFKSRSAANNVGEILEEARIPLLGLDYSKPGFDQMLPEDGEIEVIRVKDELFLESEPIPFESTLEPAADLEIDNRKIVQRGVFGLNTKRIRVRYEDDIEIARLVEAEYISQEPAPEITGYGTKIVQKTLDTPSGPIQYWRALEMYAISYNVTSSGGDGITATGLPLEKGIVAIDPRYIPYGTRMYVPGYGHALAADTGGGIKGRMIDLGYRDEDYESWHQWVTVYFLWPPPETVAWIIP